MRGVGANQMAREFVRDISEGFRGTDIKAGLLKCAADLEGVTRPLEVMARAVARAVDAALPVARQTHGEDRLGRSDVVARGQVWSVEVDLEAPGQDLARRVQREATAHAPTPPAGPADP